MEICLRTLKPQSLTLKSRAFINSYPRSLSLLDSTVQFNTQSRSICPRNLCPVSRQFQSLQSISFARKSTRVADSPSSSAGAEADRLLADVKVTVTPEPDSSVRVAVVVPEALCADCHKSVIKDIMRKVKVPGFRQGKVPESTLVDYVGKENVNKATIEAILNRTLPHALSSVAGIALTDSLRIVTNSNPSSLSYEAIIDVEPEVKWIAENAYKNLKIVVEVDSEMDAQRACEQELKCRHKSLGALRIVTDRGLQVGDVAVIDISATTVAEDESQSQKIPSAEKKDFYFDTEEGDKVIPGFLDEIIGLLQGETRSFQLKFPETWKQENLQGVNAQFTVECKELFYRDLPELNDSLADKLLPGCSSLQEVRDTLIQKCQEIEQRAKEEAADNAILDQLSKMVEVEIPQSLVEEQGRQIYGAIILEIQAKMKLNEDQLDSLSSPEAVHEYLENQREKITEVIKQNLALGDIFRRENLQVSSEEFVKEVQNTISEFKRHKKEYDEERIKEQVHDLLEAARVLEWLKERAEIRYITR